MKKGYIKGIEYYLPELIDHNDINDRSTKKIGISEKRIASSNEFASDLAFKAALKLFEKGICTPNEVEFLLYCTQSPDYYLPTTACILQDRLNLPKSVGALDFNLGCSGYVYGLSLAKGLIETGMVSNVLLITSDTYSKYINSKDRTVRPIFGDGASATFISCQDSNIDLIGPFVFGTDGKGAENLIVPAGGLRQPQTLETSKEIEDQFGNARSANNLYMNGPEIFNFTLREIPAVIEEILYKLNKTLDDINFMVFHQANAFMLEHLRIKLNIPAEKFSAQVSTCGNTVSSSIPIAMRNELDNNKVQIGDSLLLVGFGVGYSWSACQIIYMGE